MTTYYIIYFMKNSLKRQIYVNNKQISGCLLLKVGVGIDCNCKQGNWVNTNILKLNYGDVCTTLKSKNHCIVHF